MATQIPARGTCLHRMTAGEKRLSERLEQKLEDDDLLWWDVPIGPKHTHPDFVVLPPHRGALILETQDWHPHTIRSATRELFAIQDTSSSDFQPQANSIQVMTMHASKGLGRPVVAVLASEPKETMGQEDLEMESKLAYVAATRFTLRLLKC